MLFTELMTLVNAGFTKDDIVKIVNSAPAPAPAQAPAPASDPAPAQTPAPASDPAPAQAPAPARDPAPAQAQTPAPAPAPAPSPTSFMDDYLNRLKALEKVLSITNNTADDELASIIYPKGGNIE